MIQTNYISSCLLFVATLYLSISNSYGTQVVSFPGLNENATITIQSDNEEIWDINYDISTDAPSDSTVDISKFWVKVFVTFRDDLRLIKVGAALSKEGLYMYSDFARLLPSDGILGLGSNEFEYSMQIPPPNVQKCSDSQNAWLKLDGTKGTVFLEHDTWFKHHYSCRRIFYDFTICEPELLFFEKFYCDNSITNLTHNTLIPIWRKKDCQFAAPCVLNGHLTKVLDAKSVEKCFEGEFSTNKKCITLAPTPAPTPAPTFAVPDCELSHDAAEFRDFGVDSLRAVGYRSTDTNIYNGAQYHLVPLNRSSCPITYPVNVFGPESQLFEFPEGCDGDLYVTLFKNLHCSELKRTKFKYKNNGRYTLRINERGQYTIQQ